jgi:malate permease and related proteins
MFIEAFKNTSLAVMQILVLGALGYILTKKYIIPEAGVKLLSRLVVEVTLPAMIFHQLIKDFRFDLYPQWWIFPLLSFAVTAFGLCVGFLFSFFVTGRQHKQQLISLVGFQNSAYLPLALITALVPAAKADTLLTMLFLFLLGFNLLVWSLGLYILSAHENKRFELASLFSPPVIAILFGLFSAWTGFSNFIPLKLLKPVHMVGECTLPLALFVVGGNLALTKVAAVEKRAMTLALFAKLIILPLAGYFLVMALKVPVLTGFLIMMQLSVPSATSLSVITRHYKKEDILISQGVFFGHILAIITVPLFLGVYLARVVLQ